MNSQFVNSAAVDSNTTCDITTYNSTMPEYFQGASGKGAIFSPPAAWRPLIGRKQYRRRSRSRHASRQRATG